ncbi:MAG: glycosyltransferase family 2 protein [Burkholderiales bacterium]|nr:glycosyltransferase family 2 protein [Burkholderiales bacterium]
MTALMNAPAARSGTPSISAVVPAYNEAANLPALLQALRDALRGLSPRWEIIVVDDGSRDDTAAAMRPWLQQPGVRYLALSRNFGKEAALSAGLEHARGEVVVMIDADGQHPLALLPQMLAGWRAGADAVCAVRDTRADESWAKRLGTALFYRIVNAGSPMPIPADAGDFRLMDRRVVAALLSLPERNRFLKGLYAWVGFRTEFIRYTPAPRAAGTSSFSMARLLGLALTGVTAFSTMPLRLWSGLGGVIALGAIGYGVDIVIDHFINGSPVPGWPTVVVSLMFFSGVQLLSIGILGEYVGRIFTEVKRRPIYLLRESAGQGLIDPPAA